MHNTKLKPTRRSRKGGGVRLEHNSKQYQTYPSHHPQRRPALHKGRSDNSDKGGAGADISDPGENLVNCLA